MEHKKIYNHKKITSDYAARDYLDKAEKSIIEDLKPYLKDMSMLDMGVGAGRTTKYFLPLVNCYIGADYAPNMIEECRRKFSKRNIFEVVDVRNMKKFAGDMFDFVFFSYNGIDSFDEQSRLVALKEIKRVLRNNGFFAFSSHNINWEGIYDIFKFAYIFRKLVKKNEGSFFRNIFLFFKSFYFFFRLRILNKRLNITALIRSLRKEGHGILADNSLNGRVKIYYSSYAYQLKQLTEAGFENIKTYSVNGIKTDEDAELNKGGWIHYLCRLKK
jgi:ubiquinone/menaquinone biosynthesis C-methylase UbiE